MMNVFVFPGQGSQQRGMGQSLFDSIAQFVDNEHDIDDVVGCSVRQLCLNDTEGRLAQTRYTQPCLYIVNALHYFDALSKGARPDVVAGHSLGEYNALLAGGAFDFMTGLRLVVRRGQLMGEARDGGMAAVLGLEAARIGQLLADNGFTAIDIANYNSPAQTVISGPVADIQRFEAVVGNTEATGYIPLPVSAAFHSRYMADAAARFGEFLAPFGFARLQLPVMCNVTGRPYPKQADSETIKSLLVKQITHSVQWTDTIRYLMGKGEAEYRETGPGTVLTRMIGHIRRQAEPLVVDQEEFLVAEPLAAPPAEETATISAESLGSAQFKSDYGIKYAYVTGAMYKGIASKAMVIAMGRAGLIGYFGAGGLELEAVEAAIRDIQAALSDGQSYGMNLLCDISDPQLEADTVALYLKHGVRFVEAAAYMEITPPLVRYRLKGATRHADGRVVVPNRVLAKVSRPEVAAMFMRPAPKRVLDKLVAAGQLTAAEAELGALVPLSEDICVESDSGGHTDQGVAFALVPSIMTLRDEVMAQHPEYSKRIRVGAAGGIGSPEAAAAAFVLGADFVLTGSINQATVEAGTSDAVKDLLQDINVQDTAYAPAGDMFELGAKVQVLKRGLFFPARASKLFELYQRHNSLDEIDEKTRKQVEGRYFRCSFEEVWQQAKEYYLNKMPQEIDKAEANPKYKMALVFKWYFGYSTRLAMTGSQEQKVDYQVHCGPALGAFNQWAKGTDLEGWHQRRVADVAQRLMLGTAAVLNRRYAEFAKRDPGGL